MLSFLKKTNDIIIETDRLYLRTPTKSDIGQIIQFYRDNASHLDPWDPKRTKDFYTKAYWKKWHIKAETDLKMHKACRFLITEKKSGNLIGMANFTNFDRGAFQNARLGYKISHSSEGRGFMFEALNTAIPYIFEIYKLHRIEANYMPRNERSGRLLKRLGFVEHGRAPQYLQINGIWEDHILTSKINDKY